MIKIRREKGEDSKGKVLRKKRKEGLVKVKKGALILD